MHSKILTDMGTRPANEGRQCTPTDVGTRPANEGRQCTPTDVGTRPANEGRQCTPNVEQVTQPMMRDSDGCLASPGCRFVGALHVFELGSYFL